jgi:uncharacterized protein (TIGR03435 family)
MSRVVWLGAVAMTAVIPVAVGIVSASPKTAQSQAITRPADMPKWEAVSIKPCSSNIRSGAPALSPGRMTDCETVFGFIYFAYKLFASGRSNPLPSPGISIESGPPWIRSERFTISAKAEATPTDAMMRGPMLQAILEDRFHLKIRRETREIPVYVLSVARSGAKLQPFKEGSCKPTPHDFPGASQPPTDGAKACPHFGFGRGGTYKIDAQGISIEEFCKTFLSSSLGRPVIDNTGIVGLFDFRLEFTTLALDSATQLGVPTALPSSPRWSNSD